MGQTIRIEQEFRAGYHFTAIERAQMIANRLHLSGIAEEIAEDGRLGCENSARDEEVECSLEFKEYGAHRVGYVCARNLNQQQPCLDKRMPTACVQRLLESVGVDIETIEKVNAELM